MDKELLRPMLPVLKPLAIEWAERQSRHVLAAGQPLDDKEILVARFVGVQEPEKVRLLAVPSIPEPEDPTLLAACRAVDYLGPRTWGLTLFHGIYLLEIHALDVRLRAHELRHVHQYEQAGSIPQFLETYLPDLLDYDENISPSEVDAGNWATKLVQVLTEYVGRQPGGSPR